MTGFFRAPPYGDSADAQTSQTGRRQREPEGRSPARSAGKAERSERRAREDYGWGWAGRFNQTSPRSPPNTHPPNTRGSTSRTATPTPPTPAAAQTKPRLPHASAIPNCTFFDGNAPVARTFSPMAASAERSELRGQILDGRYRIGNTIGIGGTGIVFEAERLATLERVVVKMLRPAHSGNPDLMSRVRREIEVARRVFHPGIVPVIDLRHSL